MRQRLKNLRTRNDKVKMIDVNEKNIKVKMRDVDKF